MILEYFEIVYLFSEWRTLVTNLVTSASRPKKKKMEGICGLISICSYGRVSHLLVMSSGEYSTAKFLNPLTLTD